VSSKISLFLQNSSLNYIINLWTACVVFGETWTSCIIDLGSLYLCCGTDLSWISMMVKCFVDIIVWFTLLLYKSIQSENIHGYISSKLLRIWLDFDLVLFFCVWRAFSYWNNSKMSCGWFLWFLQNQLPHIYGALFLLQLHLTDSITSQLYFSLGFLYIKLGCLSFKSTKFVWFGLGNWELWIFEKRCMDCYCRNTEWFMN
jgi:hypothetical protein